MRNQYKVLLIKIVIHFAAFLPVLNIYSLAFDDRLGADPVKAVIHFTGIGAFNLLLISLAITPLAKLFKLAYLIQTRRLIGIYAFFYALLHVINFLAFDIQFDGELFISEIIKRPYITIGMVAFLLISMLAITSLNLLKRRLGKTWQRLHNSVYLLVLLVAIHFYWSVKSELTSPLIYIAITIILLVFRYKKFKRSL